MKNERWSAGFYSTLNGTEHLFESEVNSFANNTFFQDDIILFELHNGLVSAHKANPALGLEKSIRTVEERYREALKESAKFHAVEHTYLAEFSK